MIMVVKECLKAYKQPITTVITDVNEDLFENLFGITPESTFSKSQVFSLI